MIMQNRNFEVGDWKIDDLEEKIDSINDCIDVMVYWIGEKMDIGVSEVSNLLDRLVTRIDSIFRQIKDIRLDIERYKIKFHINTTWNNIIISM